MKYKTKHKHLREQERIDVLSYAASGAKKDDIIRMAIENSWRRIFVAEALGISIRSVFKNIKKFHTGYYQ